MFTLCQFSVQFDEFGTERVTTHEDRIFTETGRPQILAIILMQLDTLCKRMKSISNNEGSGCL